MTGSCCCIFVSRVPEEGEEKLPPSLFPPVQSLRVPEFGQLFFYDKIKVLNKICHYQMWAKTI